MITIGCDPELFLRDTNGKLISAVERIGGTKEYPRPLDIPGCAVQEDNVAAEFNIPPSSTFDAFRSHIKYVLEYLDGTANTMGLQLARHIASASFEKDQLSSWQAQLFGCDPDFNAWTGKMNRKPKASDPNLRSCGGHVHVGTTLEHKPIIRAMDLFLGIPSLDLDNDTQRRELYGKAGCYRSKSYGPEYRTLSNFWIWSDDTLEWCWNGTQQAIKFVESGEKIPRDIGKHIQLAINHRDESSKQICQEYLRHVQ